uniref:Uncharacterized protein n=1 Tax=Anguilla anguilla TaxID=7936 RepID=A0A0E9S9C9_ANGAN
MLCLSHSCLCQTSCDWMACRMTGELITKGLLCYS